MRGGRGAPYAAPHARRRVRYCRSLVPRHPRPRCPSPSCRGRRGPGSTCDRWDLRERPPSLRPQHRALAHVDGPGHLPLRARPRDGRARRRGRARMRRSRWAPGSVLDPCIPCLARGIEPPCANCARGWTSSCLNLDSGIVSGGTHARLHLGSRRRMGRPGAGPLLDDAPDARGRPRPGAVALRAGVDRLPRAAPRRADRRRPSADRRAPGSSGWPRWPRSRDCSRRARSRCWLGTRIRPTPPRRAAPTMSCSTTPRRGRTSRNSRELSASRVVGRKPHLMLMGGFPYVVEAVGAPAVGDRGAAGRRTPRAPSCCWARPGSARSTSRPSGTRRPPWSGRSTTRSTRGSAPGLAGGAGRHSVDRAIDMLAAGLLPDSVVVTHEFGLEEYREAVGTAIDRTTSHAIKVVFRP